MLNLNQRISQICQQTNVTLWIVHYNCATDQDLFDRIGLGQK